MANIDRKRVTLHPLKEDGSMDLNTNLYPKTFLDGIVSRDGEEVEVALKSDLNAKADNKSVVHNTGDEEISGNKTFTGLTSFNDNIKVGTLCGFNGIGIYNQDTQRYDYIYGGTDGGDFNHPSFNNSLGVQGDLTVTGTIYNNELDRRFIKKIDTLPHIEVGEYTSLDSLKNMYADPNRNSFNAIIYSGENDEFYLGTFKFYTRQSEEMCRFELIGIDNNYRYVGNGSTDLTFYEIQSQEYSKPFELQENKITSIDSSSNDIQYPSAKAVYDSLLDKQNNLISGYNIKTINGENILGSGDLSITGNVVGGGTKLYKHGVTFSRRISEISAEGIMLDIYTSNSNRITETADLFNIYVNAPGVISTKIDAHDDNFVDCSVQFSSSDLCISYFDFFSSAEPYCQHILISDWESTIFNLSDTVTPL